MERLNPENLVLDIETSSLEYPWYGSKFLLACIASGDELESTEREYHVPKVSVYQKPESLKWLNNYGGLVIGHNILFDLVHLSYYGIFLEKATIWDTYLFEKLSWVNVDSLSLKYLAKLYFGFKGYEANITNPDYVRLLAEPDKIEKSKLAEYCAKDVYVTFRLYKRQIDKPEPACFRLSMDYLKYLVKITYNGFYADKERLIKLRDEYSTKSMGKRVEIALIAGDMLNPNSPDQVSKYFKSKGLKLANTSEQELKDHKNEDPIIPHLLQYRHFEKMSRYAQDYIDRLVDGCIHSHLKSEGTKTGRSSSSDPNIQNIPPELRGCFKSRFKDGVIFCPDIDSLEYRLIAHLSKDQTLLDLFSRKKDIHMHAVHKLFLVNDPTLRPIGKVINYSAVYGCGYEKFRSLSGINNVAMFYKTKEMYPGVDYLKVCIDHHVRQHGSITNIFGRKRIIHDLKLDTQREIFNWVIQSSGHDILKIYIMQIMDDIERHNLKALVVNDVHDEVVIDCAPESKGWLHHILAQYAVLNDLIQRYFGVKLLVDIPVKIVEANEWV